MTLESAFVRGRLAFIPYLMAGDPDMETTIALARALAECGAAAIELGIPYGDPLADGPAIAAAGMRALRNGTSIGAVLEAVTALRGGPPIVLFTYFNPVYQYGVQRFARDAAGAGAAGAIVPDVTIEESAALREALAHEGLAMPLLVAPSTPPSRATRIAQLSTGFVYLVTRLGVTGANRSPDTSALKLQAQMLRAATQTPLAAGFGVSTAAHVDALRGVVDGVIAGSALIEAYAGTRGEAAAARVTEFACGLLSAR